MKSQQGFFGYRKARFCSWLPPITKLSSLHLHSLIRRPKTEFNYSSQEVGLLASISPLFNKDAKVALKKGPPDSGCCQEALNLIWVCPSLPPQLQDPWSAVSETVKDVIRQTEPLSLVTSMYLVTSLPTVQHQSNVIFIAVKTFSPTSLLNMNMILTSEYICVYKNLPLTNHHLTCMSLVSSQFNLEIVRDSKSSWYYIYQCLSSGWGRGAILASTSGWATLRPKCEESECTSGQYYEYKG